MMADDEQDRADTLAANEYRHPLPLTDDDLAVLRAAHQRRAAEDAAAGTASGRYYGMTARGRLAAERVADAQRAQLDASKETT